jgi:hypothetical protein
MYTGDVRTGVAYEARPGVEADRYARPDDMLWRYMPFDRFREAIATGKLFFVRLSTYVREGTDDHEGASPRLVPDALETVAARNGSLEQYKADEAKYGILKLQTVLVNCWHKREHEEDWMWNAYGCGRQAVAIVTRLDWLIDAVPEYVTVGHVEYADFATEPTFYANIFSRAFMKRRVHRADLEVRAVMQDDELIRGGWGREVTDKGLPVPVNLARLMETVVVRGAALLEPAKQILAEAGFVNVPVRLSELLETPRY